MEPGSDSPVYAFLKNPSMVDFTGRLAVVLFISGCNFRCGFCHNPDLMRRKQKGLPWARLRDACTGFRSHWVNAAVITGGEPTLDPDLPELIRFLRSFGWAVKLDTNGSRPDVLRACLPELDYVAMDIKAALNSYPALTGHAQTADIEASISLIKSEASAYEFRTTIIEPVHTDEEMKGIGALVAGAKRYVIQPFVPQPNLPDPGLSDIPRTSPDRLRDIARLMGPFVKELAVRGE